MADDYRRLSTAEKERYCRDRVREPSTACPACEAQTAAVDLLEHLAQRCAGPRAPHHASRWLTWQESLSLGVHRGTLSRWVSAGRVRVRTETDGRRRYLLRDLARRIAVSIRKPTDH